MNLNDLEWLTSGDFVKYVGPEVNNGNFKIGRNYEITDVNIEGQSFEIIDEYVIGDNFYAKEWDLSSFERVTPEAKLRKDDYGTLIDCALNPYDSVWLAELHALAFPKE